MVDRFAKTDLGRGLRTQAALPAPVSHKLYLGADVPLSVGGAGFPTNNVACAEAYLCSK